MTSAGSERLRLPDFFIIGAMKAGTTTAFRWLSTHPSVWFPTVKEPHFFSEERFRPSGLPGYSSLFAGAPAGYIVGEASTSYADARSVHAVSRRIRSAVPDARLIYLLRDPEERLRSHYQHEVLRGRERRPFDAALADPANPYVARSCYGTCLRAFYSAFPQERILVMHLTELISSGWPRILAHLEIGPMPCPNVRYNETAKKPAFSRLASVGWDRGWHRRVGWLPASARRATRATLLRESRRTERLMSEGAQRALPPVVHERLRLEVDETEELTGLRV